MEEWSFMEATQKKKTKALNRRFNHSWEREFAISVTARDVATKAPSTAVCRMCHAFGREEAAGSKRKKTTHDDFLAARERALVVFEPDTVDSSTVSTLSDLRYTAQVHSALQFKLCLQYVAAGSSFRLAAAVYLATKETTGMGALGCLSDRDVATNCRIACAVNLQRLKDIMGRVWAFSIGLDGGNSAGADYLDVRVRLEVGGTIHNFHLMAIPMRERHTGAHQHNLVVTCLDVLAPSWRSQLIGISSDGASNMTGTVQGVVSRLAKEATAKVFRVWCGAHQLDLVMQKAFKAVGEERFLSVLTSLTNHLRRQKNLIKTMKCTCPTFVVTRWLSLGFVLKWLVAKRYPVTEHLKGILRCRPSLLSSKNTPQDFNGTELPFEDSSQRGRSTQLPFEVSLGWWMTVLMLDSIVARVNKTFKLVQGRTTLLIQQRAYFADLVADIKSMTGAVDYEPAATDIPIIRPPTGVFIVGMFAISSSATVAFLKELGSFAVDTMNSLAVTDPGAFQHALTATAEFVLTILSGISSLVAEIDSSNNPDEALPPVLPQLLCKISTQNFIHLLEDQAPRLERHFTMEEREQIEREHRALRQAFMQQQDVRNQFDALPATASFAASWKDARFGGEDCKLLRTFCGEVASVMPGTASVEADFSLINMHKNPQTRSLTDFSLESILHAKQFDDVGELWWSLKRSMRQSKDYEGAVEQSTSNGEAVEVICC